MSSEDTPGGPGELTNFTSLPVKDIKRNPPVQGRTYYMDVILSMDKSWTMCESYWNRRDGNEYYNQMEASSSGFTYDYGPIDFRGKDSSRYMVNFSASYNGRYFGPATNKWAAYWNGSQPVTGAHYNVSDPAQAPFTPPYYYGRSTLRLEYTAGAEWSNLNTDPLITMFDTITASFFNDGLQSRINQGNLNRVLGQSAFTEQSFAYTMAQTIDDSLDWRSLLTERIASTTTTAGGGTVTSNVVSPELTRWAIAPKWECPVLNFADQPTSTIVISGGLHPTCSFSASNGWLDQTPIGTGRGMWSGYGSLKPEKEGLRISLVDSPSAPTTGYNNSLLDIMKFSKPAGAAATRGMPSHTKLLGTLAESRTLSEAVIAIPYVSSPITGRTTTSNNSYIENFQSKFFFTIDYDEVFERVVAGADFTLIPSPKPIIQEMINNMQKFIIPPQLDFPKFVNSSARSMPPIVMYIFPFSATLLREDLQDIWQGILPRIGIQTDKQQSSISHTLDSSDPFYRGDPLPANIRWMVFKVKERGATDYSRTTITSEDDTALGTDYGYNWPYDFCSLVELGKITTSFNFTKR